MTSPRSTSARTSRRDAARNLAKVLTQARTLRALARKTRHDHILTRSSALAFDTLLAIVPLTAVAMSLVRALGGVDAQGRLLRFLAAEYIPRSAGGAVQRVVPLIEHLDLARVGWFGFAALLPVIFTLVDAVEKTLSDVFGAPRRTHVWRIASLAGVLTLGPIGSVLTVRYVPWDALGVAHVLAPLLVITLLLYGVFRGLPSIQMSDRAAFTGAFTAGVLLSIAKASFGLYATHLATSIHLIWGAIAFVPLLLVWVLLSWATLLIGAEITATVQTELLWLERPLPPRTPRRRRARSRLRRRLRRSPRPTN